MGGVIDLTTELLKQDLRFDVTVNTEIKMNDQDKLEQLVGAVEKKYNGLIFTDENEKEAKETRAELNSLAKKISDERKRIKRTFNDPLKKFEDEMNAYENRIKSVSEPIAKGLADLEARQREERKQEIIKFIEESASNYEIEPNEVVIQDTWLIKSLSNIKRMKLVSDEMTRLQKEKETLATNISVIEAYCSALSIDTGGWVSQLNSGVSPAEIMKSIDAFVKAENERIKREEQAVINKAKLEAERLKQEENDRLEHSEQKAPVEVPEKDFATIEQIFVEQPSYQEPAKPELETLTLKFTGTTAQIDALGQYISQSGLKVEKI